MPLGRAVGTVPAQKEAGRAAAQLRAGRKEPQEPECAPGWSWSWQPWMQDQYPSSLASYSVLHCPSPSTVNRESLSAGWFDLVEETRVF